MQITGRLTANATTKTVGENKQVVNFSVAVNDRYKVNGEVKTVTTYVECAYWNRPGVAPFLTKGTIVEIYGHISARAYVTNSGEPKAALDFHVDILKMHGGASNAQNVAASEEPASEHVDDLPF